MKLGHVELFVTDAQRSRDFYVKTLGARLVAEQGEGIVWVDLHGLEILLRKGDPGLAASTYQSSGRALVLYTDELMATKAMLESRGLTFEGFDGAECCPTFRDPDGHWFQLVDPEHPGN
jgi:catechol 2,3-dioxygenase-like lactoylglutathione lyase family enzyme